MSVGNTEDRNHQLKAWKQTATTESEKSIAGVRLAGTSRKEQMEGSGFSLFLSSLFPLLPSKDSVTGSHWQRSRVIFKVSVPAKYISMGLNLRDNSITKSSRLMRDHPECAKT